MQKHPITFNIEINGDISKNHFGEVLVAESNLEWVEQCLRSKETLLSSMIVKPIWKSIKCIGCWKELSRERVEDDRKD